MSVSSCGGAGAASHAAASQPKHPPSQTAAAQTGSSASVTPAPKSDTSTVLDILA